MTDRPTKRRSVLPPGTCIAERYELRAVLGEGGSSLVYAARDLRTGDEVAIKVLDPEPEHRATERERMFREARITEQLCHDGIVRVREAGPLPGGKAYLVMERLVGRTLAHRMSSCFWVPLEEAFEVAGQLLDALAAAHDFCVVHRDVNPANVFLLDGDGVRVKLIDFGIGRDLGDPQSRVTAPDVVVGTLGYMAPEQLFGDGPSIRSDIYGVGATLYEMLTGRAPHEIREGDVRAVLCAMLEPVEPISSLRPAVPRALAEGVMRALEHRPDDRHGSCGEMAHACELVSLAA